VTDNNEERPFNRDQRRWVYASSKLQNNYFGFGSDNEQESSPNYPIIKHAVFPLPSPHPGAANYDSTYAIPCVKVLGGFRNRAKAFRPSSVINISGMSFGSLSGVAVEALNRGGKLATPDRDPRWPVRLEDGCRSARWPRAWCGLRRRSANHVRP
jgi:glutamate synthase (ferredoxin)